jgi:amino acid transporter
MERARKFGTFGGVFTPSLLTILGVIMYLRLGWIVGQSGLIYTIGIILVAHIISITTGLSLSSIATDKKIKAGGIYYMLSRSLGLPIGGAIGVTIFMAMALSISLYIVGFSESFLSVDAIRDFLKLEQNINSYRILGSAVVAIITIIAFISTSLAIKLQYFVLTAIALSLVSVLAGMVVNIDIYPALPSITPAGGSPSPDVLFAIFFPAVTGFTVGVAMSGDLKNPNKSIPLGTMLAILSGLIIYVGLAITFALFVDRSLLIEDSTFLQKIALIPVLVIAGIWGATLSSALGGILGGPRIIQALAMDKLAPEIISKSFGLNNEPRIAILLTFIIALGGVLIGDLNTIARVVSMFFIAAYGFINLAFALESWASTDFRPSFKIPRWIGWLGFIASIIVMIQIDLIAMLVALVLIWVTWYLMKKREQKIDPGDVWQSVWSSVIRHSLFKMNARVIEERNWKPNIMLFSGNPNTREKLIELGKALIANHGLLTIINLHKTKKDQKIQSRFSKNIVSDESNTQKGIFTREYPCTDIYDGIENLAQTYGFAGVEPNTVLMGWTRQPAVQERFTRLIKNIINMDLNILLMDYDQQKGFGKRKTIDIWWRGSGNNGNLAINLVKFLWLSHEWKDSKTRLMIENPVNDERDNIYNFAREVLDNLRVNAEINIINNEIEKKSFYDIIRAESMDSDIIFMGIPEIEEGRESEFVEQTHALCNDLGTVVLIKASSQFKRLNIGLKSKPHRKPEFHMIPSTASDSLQINPDIKWPVHPQAESFCKKIHEDVINQSIELRKKAFGKTLSLYAEILNNAQNRVDTTFNLIEKKILNKENNQPIQNHISTLYKLTNNTFIRYEQILTNLSAQLLDEQKKNLEVFFDNFTETTEQYLNDLPEILTLSLNPDDLKPHKSDKVALRFYKWRKRFAVKGNARQKIFIRKLIGKYYPNTWQIIRQKTWQKFASLSIQYLIEQQNAFKQFRDSLQIIETAINNDNFSKSLLIQEKEKVSEIFSTLKDFITTAEKRVSEIAQAENTKSIQNISNALNHIHVNSILSKQKPQVKLRKQQIRNMDNWPETWKFNQSLQVNYNLLELKLSEIDYKLWHFTLRASEELQNLTQPDGRLAGLQLSEQILDLTERSIEKLSRNELPPQPAFSVSQGKDLHRKIKDIEDFTLERISTAISRLPGHVELLKNQSYTDLSSVKSYSPETEMAEVSKLIHFIIQSDYITPFQQNIKNFSQNLEETEKEIMEIARLIKITLTGDKEEPQQIPDKYFFAEQEQRAQEALQNLENISITVDDKLQSILNKVSTDLSIPVFLKTADNMKLFVKSKEAQGEKDNWLKMNLRTSREFLRRNLVKIWFDRSKRMVYAFQTRHYQSDEFFPVSQLHALNEEVSARENVLTKVPPYYQQLFLRKNNYFMDFWQGKPGELDEAHKTILRQEKGHNGALLIRGEHNSGKTFMVNFICHKYLSSKPVYVIQPPFAGSTSESEFLSALQKATDLDSGVDEILADIPEKSVLVFEDLELWWEKTPGGLKIIELLCNLIEKYGSRVFFIITVNLHAFNSINRFKKIDPWLLSTIDCYPFNAEELKNIIMQRHKSGNLNFIYKGKKEDEMRSWDYARLFNTYFNYTRGNVGLTLQTWMASITDVKDNTLMIRAPKRPDTNVLSRLRPDTLIFLVQFILHKRLNYDKIQRIMFMTPEQVKEKIMHLKRAAIVTEPSPGVFMLNPNLHPFIRERLIEKELL